MNKQSIILVLLLVGCNLNSAPEVEYIQNHTIEVQNRTIIEYIQNYTTGFNTIEYIERNITCKEVVEPEPCQTGITQTNYTLQLIRQIKACEYITYRNYTANQLRDELESANKTISKCEAQLEKIRKVVEED